MLRLHDDGPLAWCVVQTMGGKEKSVTEEIARIGLSAYWPEYVITVRKDHRLCDRRKSLFPSYVFGGIPVDTDWRWRELCRVSGQIRVLGAEANPHWMPWDFVRELLGHEGELAHNLGAVRRSFEFSVGQQVKPTEGPFAGLWTKLMRLDDNGRVVLLLNLLGRRVPIRGLTVEQISA